MTSAKSVVITGAGSGIGQSTSLELAKSGYGLVLWDISPTGLEQTRSLCSEYTSNIHIDTVDVSEYDALESAASRARAAGHKVRGVVAGAGIVRLDSILRPDAHANKLVSSVNIDGVQNALIVWAKDLVEGGTESSAVIIGSTEGVRGSAMLNTYCRSKAAVTHIAKCAAIELGPLGVRVNSILPGTINTPMYNPESHGPEAIEIDRALQARTPLRRLGQPEEVGKVIKFLLSSDASYVTGAEILVDGGLTA